MNKCILHLGTQNPGKLREYRQVLGQLPNWSFPEVSHPEPEEIGDSFSQISELKSRYYAKATNMCCLAEDAGIVVPVLGGLPGIYSARFAQCSFDFESGELLEFRASSLAREDNDQNNNRKLISSLSEFSDKERSAYYVAHISVAAPSGEILYSKESRFHGRIVLEARGENGFGYDSIFEPLETPGKTAAQLESDEKNMISHRAKGVASLKEFLEENRLLFLER